MKIHECEQYSDAWYRAKNGIPSASQFHNIITPTGVPTRGDRRMKYMYRLIAEKLLKQSMDDRFENYWTKRGKDMEGEAAWAFAGHQQMVAATLQKTGFLTTNDGKVGASPDRLIAGTKEAVEIKCPSPWVQVEYLLQGVEDNYKPQVQGQMLVGDFAAVHLWCWHPNMPPYHQVFLRDEDYIERMRKELWYFCNELDAETDRAQRLGPFKLAETLRLSAELHNEELPGTFPWVQ